MTIAPSQAEYHRLWTQAKSPDIPDELWEAMVHSASLDHRRPKEYTGLPIRSTVKSPKSRQGGRNTAVAYAYKTGA